MDYKTKTEEILEQAEDTSKKKYPSGSKVINKDTLLELCYDADVNETYFYLLSADELEPKKVDSHQNMIPLSPESSIIKNKVILFPSKIEEYGDEEKLMDEIRNFIHKYLDISDEFEAVCAYYVMISTLYEKMPVVPYLRVIGDYGSGKTRFLHVIGSISRNPIFASGATTTSPMFRLISEFGGTFLMDEADFSSEMKSDMTKILNQGNMPRFPVIRAHPHRPRDVISYNVFGPKIVATRGYFDDDALESRMITEKMENKKLRDGILITIQDEFWEEGLHLRNKLLKFRMDHFFQYQHIPITEHADVDQALVKSLDPRQKQIIEPMLSLIKDADLKNVLLQRMKRHADDLKVNRGFSFDVDVLEIMLSLAFSGIEGLKKPHMQDIADRFNAYFQESTRWKLTARKIGHILRTKFLLITSRDNKGFYIAESEENLKKIADRYDIDTGLLNEKYNQGTDPHKDITVGYSNF